MTNKQFKRTEIETPQDYKVLKAPQAVIVLKAIEDLKEFDLKQLDEKCAEFGLVTTSKRGIRMVADWYRRIFKEDGLVVEIKVEKPVKETKTSPRKKSNKNQSKDTNIVEMSEIISKVNEDFIKEKSKKPSIHELLDMYDLEDTKANRKLAKEMYSQEQK